MSDPSLVRFRSVAEAALRALEARRDEVNDLNVFPVADGDTGDNMVLTLRAVLAELDRLATQEEQLDELGRDEIVDSVARAALLGARGNSGVILSQLIRGAAEELISRPGELVDPVLVSAALARAADRAYASVREPAEGTILTVIREMAHRVAIELPRMSERRLEPEAGDAKQNELLAAVLQPALDAGAASVERGPELLDVLREAGVVDAGGYGLVVIVSGVIAALRGSEPPELPHHHAPPSSAHATHLEHHSSTRRYCTNFVVTGHDLDASIFVAGLEALGDSVLVVGDHSTLKVHVHVDEPERAMALFAGAGRVSRLDVADMRAQMAKRAGRLTSRAAEPARCRALAVVAGDGMAALFESLGAIPLRAGRTLNPSTYELLAGIHAVPADEVVVLPNSPNVIMAAERAAELSDREVVVVTARSQQAGLAAVVALEPGRTAAENAAAMVAELEHVRTGGVAEAARDDAQGRFRAGHAVGFVDDELVAWGDAEATLRAVLVTLGEDAELLTCIAGAGAPLPGERIAALAPAGVEIELSEGGQPSWWWLIAAE